MVEEWLGPYTITKSLSKGVFQLSNLKTGVPLKAAVNQCRLRIYNQRPSDKGESHRDSDPGPKQHGKQPLKRAN